MKIAFLCKSLEPGRDGVGDYTRRLAGELIRMGHPSVIIGLNDQYAAQPSVENQKIEGSSVSILRLPENISWNERAKVAGKWLNDFSPDWISVQFVPFAFNPKGIIKEFTESFGPILQFRKFHVMFHELWILWSFPLSLRKRLLGQYQKFYIRNFVKKLKPDAITTQLPLYQAELKRLNIGSSVSPLHGNIPVFPQEAAERWFIEKYPEITFSGKKLVGFFGNLLPTLALTILTSELNKLQTPKDKLLVFLAGKTGEETARLWNLLEQRLAPIATFKTLGPLDENEASHYFSMLDYGLTSYPTELMHKSGSVAAMLEHGLPVIPCGRLATVAKNTTLSFNGVWTVKESALLLIKQLEDATT